MMRNISDLLEKKPACNAHMKGPYDDHSLEGSLTPADILLFDHTNHPDTGLLTTFSHKGVEYGVLACQGRTPYLVVFTQEGYAATKDSDSAHLLEEHAEEQRTSVEAVARQVAQVYGAHDQINVEPGRAFIPLLDHADSAKIALFVERLGKMKNIEPRTGYVSLYALQPLLRELPKRSKK